MIHPLRPQILEPVLQKAGMQKITWICWNPEMTPLGWTIFWKRGGPAMPVVAEPVASGEILYGNDLVTIDASNTEDGYIMIRYTEETGSRH